MDAPSPAQHPPRPQTLSFAEILALSRSLTVNQPLGQQLTQIAQAIEVHLGYRCVLVNLYDAQARVLRASAAVGLPDAVMARLVANPAPEAFLVEIFRPEHQISSSYFIPAQVWGDPSQIEDALPWTYHPPIAGQGPDAWQRGDDLLVPIRLADGELIGYISVDAPSDGRRPTLEQVQVLEIFANQAATAILNSRLYEQARMQAERLAVLNEIGRVLTSTLELQTLYRTIVDQTQRVLLVDAAYIVLYDEKAQCCHTVYTVDQGLIWVGDREWMPNEGPASTVIRSRQPLLVHRTPEVLRREKGTFGDLSRPSASQLHVPMVIGERVVGVISVQSYRSYAYSDGDLQVLSTIASQAAIAIENARLFTAEQQARAIAEHLRATAALIGSILDPQAVLSLILAQLDQVLPSDEAAILRVDASAASLAARAIHTEELASVPAWVELALRVAAERQPLEMGIAHEEGYRLIGVPLIAQGQVLGVLGAARRTPTGYPKPPIPLLSSFADHAALALYNAQLVEQLQQTISSLRRTQDQLVRQEKLAALGQLVAGVAHELNNPLAAVMGFSELLLSEPLPATISRDIERIYQAAARCARIVRNLLIFARPSVKERQPIDLNHVVALVLDLHRYPLHVDSIELRCELAPELQPVLADPFQLQQVLVNLLSNAHHALRGIDGPRRLVVSTAMQQGWVSLSVADGGPGIEPEIMARIFDPFFSTKQVGEGTGLGLSTAYSIVEAHGGQFDVESEPGQGARFTVWLPAVEQGSLWEPEADLSPVQRSTLPRPGRVLVVDDEPIVARLVERILSRAGYQVDVVNDGVMALKLLRPALYSAVIMDLKMPGIDGPALYQQLCSSVPELHRRVLFTTGDSVSSESRQFLLGSGQPFLTKPFTMDALLQAVRQLLEEPAAVAPQESGEPVLQPHDGAEDRQ